MTEEAMLFRRVQEGCWEAFDVLFHTYAEQLFFYAMGFVNNREEARDIVQGTFITLWEQMRRRSLRCNMPVCGKWWMVCRRNAGKFLFWDA